MSLHEIYINIKNNLTINYKISNQIRFFGMWGIISQTAFFLFVLLVFIQYIICVKGVLCFDFRRAHEIFTEAINVPAMLLG